MSHKKKNNDNESLRTRARAAAFSLLRQQNQVIIRSGREVLVEGCRGIIEYSDTLIRVSVGQQALSVIGCDLSVSNMFSHNILIIGRISSVEFS